MSFLPETRFRKRFSRIGLDLGTSHVKAVQLRQEGKQICLHRCGHFPLPEGTVEQGRITDCETLAGHLKQFIAGIGFKKRAANICIGNKSVILRSITLPDMPPREIPGAVRWESEKHVMLPPDEVVTDYAFDREITVDGKKALEVKLVAVPRTVIGDYLEVAAQAGLNPETVEIEPFSLNRAVCFFSGNAESIRIEGMLLLIDIGSRCSNLLIMENGEYAFSRSLSMGVANFCTHVAAVNNVSPAEAANLVFGDDPFSVPGFRDAAGELAELINRSLEYYVYRMNEKEMKFSRLLLCGGGALIKDMPSFLSGLSGDGDAVITPKPFSIFDYINCRGNNSVSHKEKTLFAVAGGLALRGWAVI